MENNQDYERNAAQQIAEEAALWMYTLERADEGELDSFVRWLMQSPRHEEAFIRAVELDQALSGGIDLTPFLVPIVFAS
jgi:ferric-dicitrate binding protein FerR (iron transport regulator)